MSFPRVKDSRGRLAAPALLLPLLLGAWLGWALAPGRASLPWERSWLDLAQVARILLRGPQPPHPDLVWIGLDADAARVLDKPSVFWLSDLARLAGALRSAGARGVAFDMIFSATDGRLPPAVSSLLAEERLALLQKLATGDAAIGFVPQHTGAAQASDAEIHNHPDLEAAAQESGNLVSLAVHTDADGVIRTLSPLLPRPQGAAFEPSLSCWMVQRLGHQVQFSGGRLTVDGRLVPTEGSAAYPTLRSAYRTPQRSIVSAGTLLRRMARHESLSEFRDKVCVIAASEGVEDLRPSVYDLLPSKREAGSTQGVEHHLAAAETLLEGSALVPFPGWEGALASMLAGLLLCGLGRWTPLRGQWLALPAVVLLGVAGNLAAFVWGNCWLPAVAPLLTGLVGYGCGYQWRHLGVERQRRLTHDLFARMVSPQVVDKVLSDPGLRQLGGREQRVTVLYTDINHFTPMCEKHTPAAVIEMLNAYFEAMVEIVFAHQGLLKQFVGDEIMVIYGAPAEQPDHAARAVTTALDMLEELQELERAAGGQDGFFDIKVGINTGDVVIGHVGSEQHMEYAAVGDDVNLGARVMATTKKLGVKILVSETTRLEAQPLLPNVEWISHGVQSFKGKTAQIEVYEVRRRPS